MARRYRYFFRYFRHEHRASAWHSDHAVATGRARRHFAFPLRSPGMARRYRYFFRYFGTNTWFTASAS